MVFKIVCYHFSNRGESSMSKSTLFAGLMQTPVRAVLAAFVLASLLVLDCSRPVLAQTPATPTTPAPTPAPSTDITKTLDQLLRQFPKGGPELTSKFRELAANPANIAPLLGLLPMLDGDQKSALGSALAQAARIASRNNLPYATQIQQDVAGTKDQDLIVAFA